MAAGITGCRMDPLACFGRSRWPFILESFVQSRCFRVGPAMPCIIVRLQDFCFRAVGAKKALLVPTFLVLGWHQTRSRKPFPTHHSRNCWLFGLKCQSGDPQAVFRLGVDSNWGSGGGVCGCCRGGGKGLSVAERGILAQSCLPPHLSF